MGLLDAGPDDVPGLEVAADVAVAVDAPPDAGPDAFEAPPPPDVAVAVDAAPEAGADAPTAPDARAAELVARVAMAGGPFDVVSVQCSASGWGTAAGPVATFRVGLSERAPRMGTTWVTGSVGPGPSSMALPEERVVTGVSAMLGEPYATAAGARVDFEARATFRAAGVVVVTVTGCPVTP